MYTEAFGRSVEQFIHCCLSSAETVGTLGAGSPGRPPRLSISHGSWDLYGADSITVLSVSGASQNQTPFFFLLFFLFFFFLFSRFIFSVSLNLTRDSAWSQSPVWLVRLAWPGPVSGQPRYTRQASSPSQRNLALVDRALGLSMVLKVNGAERATETGMGLQRRKITKNVGFSCCRFVAVPFWSTATSERRKEYIRLKAGLSTLKRKLKRKMTWLSSVLWDILSAVRGVTSRSIQFENAIHVAVREWWDMGRRMIGSRTLLTGVLAGAGRHKFDHCLHFSAWTASLSRWFQAISKRMRIASFSWTLWPCIVALDLSPCTSWWHILITSCLSFQGVQFF